MNSIQFTGQFNRLIETYGKKAFPEERNKLIWKQLADMDADWFTRLVDKMIGDLRHAPMLADFRDAANRERKRLFDQEVNEATREWTAEHQGLRDVLASYGGAKSLFAAVQFERRVIREMEGIPDSAWPKIVNEAAKISMAQDKQRELASTIKDLNEAIT